MTTTKNLTLQFSGDGTLASGGSLTLGANLSVLGDGSISIGSTVNVGSHHFTVDTQTASGTTINITGPIHASSGGIVSILGQQTVTIGAVIDPPTTLTLSSLDDVVVNAAVQAINTVTVSAGEDGTGGFTIGAAGSLEATAPAGTIGITTGTTSGNVALGGTMVANGMSIITAGTVNQTGGIIIGSTLGISSGGSLSMNQNNAVNTVAMAVSGAGNSVSYTNNNSPLTIGTVGSINGITTSGGNVLVDAASISITQPISVGAATVRLLSGSGVTESGSGTISASALGVRAAGDVTLTGNNSTPTFAADNSNISSVVKYSSSGSITLGTVGASGTFGATSGIITLGGDVLLKAGTSVAVNQPISASTGTVRLVALNGGISQGAAPITAAALGVRATDDVLLDTAGNDVNTFAAFNSGAGKQIRFADVDDLAVGAITADGANFAATSGVITTGGPVLVSAGAGLAINTAVSGNGGVSLSGVGVTQSSASTVDGGSGLVVIDAGNGAVNLAGVVTTTSSSASAVQIANATTTVLGDTVALAGGLDIAGATGNVTQNTGTIIQVNRVSVDTGGSVTLDKSNAIDQVLAMTSSGGLIVNDSGGGLVVTGPISNGAGDFDSNESERRSGVAGRA